MEGIDRFIQQHDLYREDDLVERPADAALPPVERPVLRRLLILAHMVTVEVIIVDRLESFGADAAIRGGCGGGVPGGAHRGVCGRRPARRRLVQAASPVYRFETVDDTLTALTDHATQPPNVTEQWARLHDEGHLFSSTSAAQSSDETRANLLSLIENEGLSHSAAARQLRVGGYRNEQGRVAWYTENVRRLTGRDG